jgi:phospholipase C
VKNTDRRQFLQLMGMGAVASTLNANIAKALSIPAHYRTGTIRDVEHIVVLMQENRPFDHHFGTLRGVRGFADPRAAKINLPRLSGTGTTPASVFLQPSTPALTAAGYSLPPGTLGGPTDGMYVIPPFRINPESVKPGLTGTGSTYLPGTGHSWSSTHAGWNHGKYDGWVVSVGPMAMSYMTREDIPYHFALADAFTVGDAYFCSLMGPTNPNRCYMWTGCIGNVNYLGAGGTDGKGAGPITSNGLSSNHAYYVWETFPEVLQAAGISWKIYQDIGGATFAPDFGDGAGNDFAGNYADNSVLYFNQYATAAPGTPLFDRGCTGTRISEIMPDASASAEAWQEWAEHLFDDFRNDVKNGKLPQVSWICAPAGYTEHSSWPMNYGAWFISQIFDILVSNPEVFSKTVFLINYDEADGSFDHIVPPAPPETPANGASTVSIENEILPNANPPGAIGFGQRVPLLAISPWSKGGYVSSQVFDHTSVIRFIEKRFGVFERNISPWRRAVAGDLTSLFNFANPNAAPVRLPETDSFLPPVAELAGGDTTTFVPTPNGVFYGVPRQERGVRPARALPYELNVHGTLNHSNNTFVLDFINTGKAAAVFHVRSTNAADPVRYYTVEPGKRLSGSWTVTSTYDLSVYGPNGFARYFRGSAGANAAALELRSACGTEEQGSIGWRITNVSNRRVTVEILDAYTGHKVRRLLMPHQSLDEAGRKLHQFFGWYDLVVTVPDDPTFEYRLAGHVETGRDSFSDPALGGLVTLQR